MLVGFLNNRPNKRRNTRALAHGAHAVYRCRGSGSDEQDFVQWACSASHMYHPLIKAHPICVAHLKSREIETKADSIAPLKLMVDP